MQTLVPKIGGIISRTRTVSSSTQLKLQQFLSDKARVGPSVMSTLVQIQRWVASVQEYGTGRMTVKAMRRSHSDLIEDIAESLIDATGVERKLLSKSLQETLFYCVGFQSDIDHSRFKTQLTRYVD